MVSTRKIKDKFSEGDRVLCYEPDPTKAKVLYDSKVLEVKVEKDDRGRRTVAYLIHFQGWNSSWDRVVDENFVLKDTEENRQLQKDLAAKARLQIGAYLYRKDFSDKEDSTLSEKGVEAGNSCSSQDENVEDEYLTASDDDNASSVETDDSLEQKVPLELPPTIRMLLETDFDLINQQFKLVKLPASPCIVEILEMYIRHMCSRAHRTDGAASPRPRSRSQSATPQRPVNKAEELEWICARVNLAKEMVDGLRICFDFYVESQLLYSVEVAQFERVKKGLIRRLGEHETKLPIKVEECRPAEVTEAADVERRRSLRSHKEPAPEPTAANGVSRLTARNLGLLGNQLAVSNSGASARSCSSVSSYCGPLASHAPHIAGPLGPEMAKLMALTNSWQLVPDSYLNQNPSLPSAVYGAIHLARLFVKLPNILYAANLPDKENQPRHLSELKMKLLLNHLQSFLSFLATKQEWFGETHYSSGDFVKMEKE